MVLTRLRQHKLSVSAVDTAAVHLHAMTSTQLRGHTLSLYTDWLDAITDLLIREALSASSSRSYRRIIHSDADPILVTLISTSASDGFGKFVPPTPQSPLPKNATYELERTGVSLPAELTLDRFTPDGLAQNQMLRRLVIPEIPEAVRQQGSTPSLAGNGEECRRLTCPPSQHMVLIETVCSSAILQEAVRHRLEVDMPNVGGIGCITICLNQAALTSLTSSSQQLLEQLTLSIVQENQFVEIGQAPEVLYASWRLGEIDGTQGAQTL